MSTPSPFTSHIGKSGAGWLFSCAVIVLCVAIADQYDMTREASWLVIGSFALWQGVWPFTRLAIWFLEHNAKNRKALPHFGGITLKQIPKLKGIQAEGEGTAMGLLVWIARHIEDLSLEANTDVFIDELWKVWQPRLDSIGNAGAQCSVLGFGFTLFGISQALREGSDLSSGLGLMMESSLVGCICGIVCGGLWLLAKHACESHETDLRKVASQFGESRGHVSNPELLF